MNNRNFVYDAPVALVGGGDINWAAFDSYLTEHIIALDGGANALVARGLAPDFVMGDFDSLDDKVRDNLRADQLVSLPNQNFTDFRKVLDLIDAPVIYAHGVLGGRMDHALDALAQISDFAARRIYLMGQHETVFVWPSQGGIEIESGKRIAFWSVGETQIQASYGLKWSLDGHIISAADMSVSNEAVGAVTITYAGDPLICLVQAGVPI